jgi:hypothetical protein
MFVKFLELCNYDTHFLDTKKNVPKETTTEIDTTLTEDERKTEFMRDSCIGIYDSIDTINSDTAESHQLKVKRKKATAQHKIELNKYWYDAIIPSHLPLYVRREYFDIYNNDFKKHVLQNAIDERRGKYAITDELYTIDNTGLEFNSMRIAKIDFILDLNARLGITHSLLPASIERKTIEDNVEFVCNNRKKIHEIFNIRDFSPDAKTDLKNAVALIDKLYKSWTGEGLKASGVKGVRSTFNKETMTFKHELVKEYKMPVPLFFV